VRIVVTYDEQSKDYDHDLDATDCDTEEETEVVYQRMGEHNHMNKVLRLQQ
jgi:hypothetical protein